jgi:hypothetical protein
VQGISASQGIAYGQIFVYLQSEVEIPSYQVDHDKRIDEIARFDKALLLTRQQIAKIQDEVEKNLGKNEALIFDAHLLVLEDQALISETIREFETTGRNIETCFDTVSKKYIQAFSEIDDEYLRERAGDIRDVAQRVLQNLLGQAENSLSRLVNRRIVVAQRPLAVGLRGNRPGLRPRHRDRLREQDEPRRHRGPLDEGSRRRRRPRPDKAGEDGRLGARRRVRRHRHPEPVGVRRSSATARSSRRRSRSRTGSSRPTGRRPSRWTASRSS